MDTLKKFAFIIILIISAGCTGNDNKTMDKAEALMQDNPQKALLLLDSLKQNSIKGNHSNARFALLYSMALDKNYIDVTDDSLICIAEDWYSRKGDVREKFLSYYYKGVVNSNAKKYPEAITAFSQAQKYENQIDDNYLLGLLYNQMGYIYENHYDYKKSLESFSKAHDLYEAAGKTNHKNYMLLNIATAYWNTSENTKDSSLIKSEFYFQKALEEGIKTNYNIITKKASQYLFIQYMQRGILSEASRIYEQFNISENIHSAVLMAALAKYHYLQNDDIFGQKFIDSAWKSCRGINDTAILYQWEYDILKHSKKFEDALTALEHNNEIQNRSVRLNLEQPILEIQKQLLEKNVEYSSYKLKSTKNLIILAGLLIIALMLIAYVLLKIWINKKNEKLNGYIILLAELQDNLQNLQEGLHEKDNQLNSAITNTKDIIKNRLSLINNLSTTIYEKRDTPKAKEIFIREVENIIEEFRTNENDLKWMEQVINSTKDNLLQNIYAKYPTLSKEEQRLLCYIYAGFSSKSISVFLNIPIETVYNRKSRILAKTGLSKAQNKITNTCKIPS